MGLSAQIEEESISFLELRKLLADDADKGGTHESAHFRDFV